MSDRPSVCTVPRSQRLPQVIIPDPVGFRGLPWCDVQFNPYNLKMLLNPQTTHYAFKDVSELKELKKIQLLVGLLCEQLKTKWRRAAHVEAEAAQEAARAAQVEKLL